MQMYHLVVQYRMTDRCVLIRNVNYPLPSPNFPDDRPIRPGAMVVQSGSSDMLEAAVAGSNSRHRGRRRRDVVLQLFRRLLDAAAVAEAVA